MQKIEFIFAAALSCLVSCSPSDAEYEIMNDPFGIIAAEDSGEISERLIQCSEDPECPEYAKALFLVAVDILSEAGATDVDSELSIQKGLSEEEQAKEIARVINEQLITGELFAGPHEYEVTDSIFKRGFELLVKSHEAGFEFASNELGLLHLTVPEIQDYNLASEYFHIALQKGDMNAAYNLARLTRIQSPNDSESVLEFLKIAASETNGNFETMYLFGLEAFGSEQEKRMAADLFVEKHSQHSSLRKEFERDFNF